MQSLNQKTNTSNLITFLLNFISLKDNSIYKKYMLSAFYVFEHCFCLEPEKKYGLNFAFYFYFYFPPPPPPPRTKFFDKNLVNQLIKKNVGLKVIKIECLFYNFSLQRLMHYLFLS